MSQKGVVPGPLLLTSLRSSERCFLHGSVDETGCNHLWVVIFSQACHRDQSAQRMRKCFARGRAGHGRARLLLLLLVPLMAIIFGPSNLSFQ